MTAVRNARGVVFNFHRGRLSSGRASSDYQVFPLRKDRPLTQDVAVAGDGTACWEFHSAPFLTPASPLVLEPGCPRPPGATIAQSLFAYSVNNAYRHAYKSESDCTSGRQQHPHTRPRLTECSVSTTAPLHMPDDPHVSQYQRRKLVPVLIIHDNRGGRIVYPVGSASILKLIP